MRKMIYFISDLHLEVDRPDITKLFFEFLQVVIAHASALYILGDLFESWVGDADRTPFNEQIKQALRRVTDHGVPVFLMHGNRDFLLGRSFMRATGCQLLNDHTVIQLHGQPTLLMHGDLLCTDDIAYQMFRRKSRNRLYQMLFLAKPLIKRHAIADNLRSISRRETSTKPDHIMDVNEAETLRVIRKYKVVQLIHGHTHRPKVHELQLDEQKVKRYVLGAWHDGGHVLACPPNQSYKLTEFTTTLEIPT